VFHRLPFLYIQRHDHSADFTVIKCFKLPRKKHDTCTQGYWPYYWTVLCVVPRNNYPCNKSPKKVAPSVVLLVCIREVPGSSLGQDTGFLS
jgi:hypothetical protein